MLAPGLAAMAVSEDGLTEAVCLPDKRFVWAVQWHPEFSFRVNEDSRKIFKAFVYRKLLKQKAAAAQASVLQRFFCARHLPYARVDDEHRPRQGLTRFSLPRPSSFFFLRAMNKITSSSAAAAPQAAASRGTLLAGICTAAKAVVPAGAVQVR